MRAQWVFSGHGTYNATIRLDKHNYTRKLTNDGFETVNATKTDSVATDDCIIGTSGKLYPVLDLKRDLLRLKCSVWTVTLDMCRNEPGTRGSNVDETGRTDSIRKVALR